MRKSNIVQESDSSGRYEVETFSVENPKNIIICLHGNGVRRWDGEDFFYNVANHFSDSSVILIDQNQPKGNGCVLNPLPTMVSRVQKQIDTQQKTGTPIIVIGHSMGCGVASKLKLDGVSKLIFVAPAVGDVITLMVDRYGPDILQGKKVLTSDGLDKYYPREYIDSVSGIIWEDEYRKLLDCYSDVFVFEAGEDDILGDRRLILRNLKLNFKQYTVIPRATHNFHDQALDKLFVELDKLI